MQANINITIQNMQANTYKYYYMKQQYQCIIEPKIQAEIKCITITFKKKGV